MQLLCLLFLFIRALINYIHCTQLHLPEETFFGGGISHVQNYINFSLQFSLPIFCFLVKTIIKQDSQRCSPIFMILSAFSLYLMNSVNWI